MSVTFLVATILVLTINTVQSKFPSDVPRCLAGDGECIASTITNIIQSNPKGHAGLKMGPIDPFRVENLDLVEKGQVSVQLTLSQLDLFGLSKGVVHKVVGFEKDPETSKFEMHFKFGSLNCTGNYQVSGRLNILPILGNGTLSAQLEDLDIVFKFTPTIMKIGDDTFLQINKFKLDFDMNGYHSELTNLFNGDKTLGDSMNQFLNENWKQILLEVKPSVSKAVGQEVKTAVNNILINLPYNEIFLDDKIVA